MTSFISWWTSAVVFGTVIMFGALGEILTEKTGHLNLGVPGMVFLGAFAGFVTSFLIENKTSNPVLLILIPLIAAFAAGALGGAVYNEGGRITLKNVTFIDNKAKSSANGKWVYSDITNRGINGNVTFSGGNTTDRKSVV